MIFVCNSVFFHKIPMFFPPKKNSYHSQCHQTQAGKSPNQWKFLGRSSLYPSFQQATFDDTRRHLASGYLTVRYGQCPINIDDLPCSLPKMVAFPALKPSTGLQNLSYRCPYIYYQLFPYSWDFLGKSSSSYTSIHSSYLQRPSIYKPHGTVDGRRSRRFSSPPRCRIRCYPPFEAPGRKFGGSLRQMKVAN